AGPARSGGGDADGASANERAQSLRELAERIGLRFGTAVIPFDLDTPDYAAVLAEQFSVVTPGNEMKWQVVEPQQGVYDWSGADRLVKFAEQHGQLVRGHVLLWHNQLPDWLTTGVANGTISSTELASLLKQRIFTEVGRYRGRIWQWDVAMSSSPIPTRPRSTRTTSGSRTSGRTSSRRLSAGPTRPTRTRCCSTTTTTSRVRTARTPRATRPTRG